MLRLGLCTNSTFVPAPRKSLEMVTPRKGFLKTKDGQVASLVDNYISLSLNRETLSQMVQTTECELLVRNVKCERSQSYRGYLRKSYILCWS